MSIEQQSEYYDKIYLEKKEYRVSYEESPYYLLWQKVIDLIPGTHAHEIVELGCGTGQFARMLRDRGMFNHYTGYDFSDTAIQMATDLNPFEQMRFRPIDITGHLPDRNALYIALETLEHCKDYKVIENIGLGKEIIFTVPDFSDPAHIRYFKDVNDVVRRYDNVLQFSFIEKFESWFICKATTI